jgi:hypothetical protein
MATEVPMRDPWIRDCLLFALGCLAGQFMAYYDVRTEDPLVQRGIGVALVLSGALMGLAQPRSPWRWALALGVWVPLAHLALKVLGLPDAMEPGYRKLLLVAALTVGAALVGACAGAWLRGRLVPAR